MVWFKVDDSLPDHPKTLALRGRRGWEAALALWTLAGAWSSKHLTDGKIPRDVVAHLGFKLKAAALLVAAGFWEHADADFQFHEWPARNPLREQVERKREATRNRVAKHRGNTVTPEDGNGVTRIATDTVTPKPVTPLPTPLVTLPPSRPVPTRPDPSESLPRAHAREPVGPGALGPPAAVSEAARLAQEFAERTGRDIASHADMQAAHGIVRQVGNRWAPVLDAWLVDPWVVANRPPLSNLDKNAHKYTAPPPVDPATRAEQLRRAREDAATAAMNARLEPDDQQLASAAVESRAVLDALRARGRPAP